MISEIRYTFFIFPDLGLCNGDAGSGLLYKYNKDQRYYIIGIVSFTPQSDSTCDARENTLFTKISFAYDFVMSEIESSSLDDCRLPPYPENGKWVVPYNEKVKEGDIVTTNDFLRVDCNDGYSLFPEDEFVRCKVSFRLPQCLCELFI